MKSNKETRIDDHTICMTLRRYCLRGVFRFYPLQSLQPCMPSYHNRYRKAKWCSEKIPTDIVATNTSGRCHTPVPRQPKSEWIRYPLQTHGLQWQLHRVPRLHSRNGSPTWTGATGGYHCSSGVASETSAECIKEKSVVLDNSWATDFIYSNKSPYL